MKSYKDLDIYKESKRLAVVTHKMSLALPKFELFEEGDTKQILLNILYTLNQNVMRQLFIWIFYLKPNL